MLVIDASISRTGSLSEAIRHQLPFALALSLDRTALDVQLAQRLRNDRQFTIRARTFMERLVKIKREDRARKDHLVARIRIEGPETSKARRYDPASVLSRHEQGGTHVANDPTRPFFIPADATRPNPRTVIPRALYPVNLGLADRRGIMGETIAAKRGNVRKIKGANGKRQRRSFFVLHSDDGSKRPLGIYERDGKDEIQIVWFFARRVTVRPRLGFFDTAEEVVGRRFPANFSTSLARALRTARPR